MIGQSRAQASSYHKTYEGVLSVPLLKFLFMPVLHVESAAAEAFDGFKDVVS